MSELLLNVKDLNVSYITDTKHVRAVNDISFYINKGETLGLVGETGAGKSTTALSIMKLIQSPPGKINSGEINFMGEDLLKLKKGEMRKILGSKISMIFQDPMTSLNPVKTIGEQITEVISLHERVSAIEAKAKACEVLNQVGIRDERFSEYPHQFSGGMRQRVVIAMALVCNPALLIADEPTTALDVTIQAQVLYLMNELKKKYNTAMIMITHDLGVVAQMCDRVAIMYAGQIVETGTIAHIFKNPQHPYTIGLFGAIPDITVKSDRLKPIRGSMPDPTSIPSGCPFAQRCDFAADACHNGEINNIEVEKGHIVKCLKCKA